MIRRGDGCRSGSCGVGRNPIESCGSARILGQEGATDERADTEESKEDDIERCRGTAILLLLD